MIAIVRLLVHLGLQSLKAHKAKTLIVGGLMTFGSFLVVVSLALLGSIDRSTRQSVVESVSGDLQIYDKNAKDQLALFGGMGFGTENVGEVESWEKLTAAIAPVDNIKAVLPMGFANVGVAAPGDVDRTLDELRKAVADNDQAAVKVLGERVRSMAKVIAEQAEKEKAITNSITSSSSAAIKRALGDQLQLDLQRDPLPTIAYLESELAPLGVQAANSYLRLVGTDLDAFAKNFERIRVVEGTMVPTGTRGLLVGKMFLDRNLKLSVAMYLDNVNNERKKGQSIAESTTIKETIGKAQRASARLAYLVPAKDTDAVVAELADALKLDKSVGLPALITELFKLDDANFEARYKLFYDVLGKRVALYPFKVGDTITLTAFTKSGYMKSLNVKVFGIYTIEGLETSEIASSLTLTDLVTFRELYGRRTAALDAELAAMKAATGAKEVDRASAEDALFGDDNALEVKTVTAEIGDTVVDRLERDEMLTFDPKTANNGFVLSTAVLLKDPSRTRETMAALQAAVDPLNLQVVDWQQATGIIGQMTLVVSAVLLTAIFILFIVTIVILNNSLVMATLERVSEFGTLRAIGAQRGFVNAMVVFETGVLGTIAGLLGAGAGVVFVLWLHEVGIPAPADLLQVVFGGPRLYPSVEVGNVVAGLVATLIVGVLATLYPARLATRVQPVVAMQGKD
ncbi:MAG TPA: FtsX-like permease family protein [Myxococcota bacterium]